MDMTCCHFDVINHLLSISCAWQAFVLGVLLLLLQVNHTATLRGLYYYHQHFRELEKQKCTEYEQRDQAVESGSGQGIWSQYVLLQTSALTHTELYEKTVPESSF